MDVLLVRTGWRERSSRNSLRKNKRNCLQRYACLRRSLRTDRPVAISPSKLHSPLSKENLVPLTILDSHAALIVVDLQKGIRDIPSIHPMASVIDHSCQ